MASSVTRAQRMIDAATRPSYQRFRLHSLLGKRQTTISRPSLQIGPRWYSANTVEAVEPPEYLSEGERRIFDMLKSGLEPTKLEVQDISGGCGSMYALDVVSEQFRGLPVIKQHRLVNKVLGDEMKKWHGVQMKTKAPE